MIMVSNNEFMHLWFEYLSWSCSYYLSLTCKDIFLREQDKGVLEGQSAVDRQDKFEDEMKRREREQIYFAPLGGESIAQCAQRIGTIFSMNNFFFI